MTTMERQDSFGLFPQELMQIIIRMSSLQVVSSFWMSNHYWHAKLKNILERPKIIFVTRDDKSRNVFILNRGFCYYSSISQRTRRIDDPTDLSLRVKNGWFNTVIELEEFISKFEKIIRCNNNTNTAVRGSEVDREKHFVKVQYKEPREDCNEDMIHVKYIYTLPFERFKKLTNKAAMTIVQPIPDVAANFNGITLHVKCTMEKIWSKIYINPDGDVYMRSKTKSTVPSRRRSHEEQFPIEVQLRTSPKLFRQLEEVIVYRKHRKSLPELDDEKYLGDCVTLLDVRYAVDGQNYFVQECVVEQGKQTVLKTNNYKNGSERKIINIIESVLFSKNVPRFLYKEVGAAAAPTFAGHQLIRLPRYKMPLDEDLPSVIAIELTLRNTTYTLHFNSKAPLKEIVAVFREAEQAIDPKDTEPCKVLIVVRKYFRVVRAIKVHSLKSFKPITKLPKPVVVKVWQLLVRNWDAPY